MNAEILIRLAWTAAIIGAGLGLYALVCRVVLARAQHSQAGLESFHKGDPGILYFTTPTCIPCKTVQRPALEKVKNSLAYVQVIEVDATERPDLADSWGVLSVPTTFIIDPKGQPRKINHGVVRAEELIRQISDVNKTPAKR